MDPDAWPLIAFGVASLFVLFIAGLSALESALSSARRSRLALVEDDPRVPAAEALVEQPEPFLTSAHLAKSLCEAVVYGTSVLTGLGLALQASRAPLPDTIPGLLGAAWYGAAAG